MPARWYRACAAWRRFGEQARIDPAFAQQGSVCALLDHSAVVQDDDGITIPDGAQAMGYDQAGAAALPELLHEARLSLGIQGTGGFIHDQEHRVSDQARAIPRRCRCPPLRLVAPSSSSPS
jgi:hypothetical protein